MKITTENYEEFALDFIEGNLDAADQKQFEAFLDANPAIGQIIKNFELVVLPSFTPTMPNKSNLFHDNSRIKPISFYIKRIAAAILALILLSAVLIQLNKQPDKALAQQQTIKEKIGDKLSEKDIPMEEKPPIEISAPEAGVTANASEKHLGRSELSNRAKKRTELFSKTEIEESVEELVLITPLENKELHGPIHTIALIQNIDIKPDIHIAYKIDHRPNFLLIENEEIQNDPFAKIGRLLARANLIPTGLQEEIEETNIREKIISETYVDFK